MHRSDRIMRSGTETGKVPLTLVRLSDVVGILIEQEESGDPFSLGRIQKAVVDLYDSYERLPENSREFIESIYRKSDLKAFYRQCRQIELENKDVLISFQDNYPGVLNGDNLADVLKAARARKSNYTIK